MPTDRTTIDNATPMRTMEKYKNRYRMPSARLKNWNYGWNAAYFITICTHKRRHCFGKITDGKIALSGIGRFAEKCWYEIPDHFPFVRLGEFVVMPNHIHGIIIIDKTDPAVHPIVNTAVVPHTVPPAVVETQDFASLQPMEHPSEQSERRNEFGPQSRNLPSIVRGYKIGVTKNARLIDPGFAWQSRYWEHIIRNAQEYGRVARYIIDNPEKWEKDKLNGGKGNVVMEQQAEYAEEIWMV